MQFGNECTYLLSSTKLLFDLLVCVYRPNKESPIEPRDRKEEEIELVVDAARTITFSRAIN